MNERMQFIKEYASFYRIERYTSLVVSIVTMAVIVIYFSKQTLSNEKINDSMAVFNAFVGLGSAGIISTAIGFIFKFMDKVNEIADNQFKNLKDGQDN